MISKYQENNKALGESMISQNKYSTKSDLKTIQSKYKITSDAEMDETPPMHFSRIIPWQFFTRDFEGKDLPVDDEVRKIMIASLEEKIDFRPYCNDNPMTVVTTDSMLKCCDLFRKMHLRHLTVINASTTKVEGMITRQDLFQWLDL